MSELGSRIKEVREEIKDLRDGGIQSDFKVTSLEQQLGRIEEAFNERSDEMPDGMRERLDRRLNRLENRIDKLQDRF